MLAVKSDYPRAVAFNTLVFETHSLKAAVRELQARGVKILTAQPQKDALESFVMFEDAFGNVSELFEPAKESPTGK